MFTGIVEEMGTFVGRSGGRVRVRAHRVLEGVGIGESIAVNGCCLTVVAFGDDWWEADLSDETLGRTNLGDLGAGSPVNLERALRLSDRLGGHLVQGHVDAVGEVVAPVPSRAIRTPSALGRYFVEKGSVAVDGVSLTIVEASDDGFSVAVIPHTAEVTTLGVRRPGDRVNIEVDVMAKQVERLVGAYLQQSPASTSLPAGERSR